MLCLRHLVPGRHIHVEARTILVIRGVQPSAEKSYATLKFAAKVHFVAPDGGQKLLVLDILAGSCGSCRSPPPPPPLGPSMQRIRRGWYVGICPRGGGGWYVVSNAKMIYCTLRLGLAVGWETKDDSIHDAVVIETTPPAGEFRSIGLDSHSHLNTRSLNLASLQAVSQFSNAVPCKLLLRRRRS